MAAATRHSQWLRKTRGMFSRDPGFGLFKRPNLGQSCPYERPNAAGDPGQDPGGGRKCEVGYVKTASGYEVDFLARSPDHEATLIQVCASVDDPDTLAREVRALSEAMVEHPRAAPLILTRESRLPWPAVPNRIRILPAWQWLIEGRSTG